MRRQVVAAVYGKPPASQPAQVLLDALTRPQRDPLLAWGPVLLQTARHTATYVGADRAERGRAQCAPIRGRAPGRQAGHSGSEIVASSASRSTWAGWDAGGLP